LPNCSQSRGLIRSRGVLALGLAIGAGVLSAQTTSAEIGREVAIPRHLQDGEECETSIKDLIAYGKKLFEAHFTVQEGAGRPLTKGTGLPLSNLSKPLRFPFNNNRISGPDANSCAGCHNQPLTGGAGDLSNNVFVLAQRFDFVDFSDSNRNAVENNTDERGQQITLQSVGNSRATPELFGSGYYEMLARQITVDLQAIRNHLQPGARAVLTSKGISFGELSRNRDGSWVTAHVEGLPPESLASMGIAHPPSLLILPFHQAGAVVSLRVFTVNSFVQHHGMQATERFGIGTDPDGDGVTNELTRADITAATIYQATLPSPTRVLPDSPVLREAALQGEKVFHQIGCTGCHIPSLPLDKKGWLFTEPNPNNPYLNLQLGQAPAVTVDLTSDTLPMPRLKPVNGVVNVPLYTDFKLHDLCKDADDFNREPLNQHMMIGSPAFFEGNGKFLTRRLWDVGDKPNFFHHGQFTTIREAILNHFGEALPTQQAFTSLNNYQQGSIIEFLKTLRLAKPGEMQ
jgi:cytochrome c peroxidase